MTDKNYQRITQDETNIGDIDMFAPEDQRCKTPAQLMSIVGSFMIKKIERMPKKVSKKKLDKQCKSSSTMSC
jgi:hypothetical protein